MFKYNEERIINALKKVNETESRKQKKLLRKEYDEVLKEEEFGWERLGCKERLINIENWVEFDQETIKFKPIEREKPEKLYDAEFLRKYKRDEFNK